MKTQIITLAITMWILLIGSALSAATGKPTSIPEYKKQALNEEIAEQVSYPEFAKTQKMDGLVLVEFEVTESGKVEVTQMNYSCTQLAEYVKSQLEVLWIADRDVKGTHFAKFNFNFVEG